MKRSVTIDRWPTGARVSASYAANKARAALVRAQLRAADRSRRLAHRLAAARARSYRVEHIQQQPKSVGVWEAPF